MHSNIHVIFYFFSLGYCPMSWTEVMEVLWACVFSSVFYFIQIYTFTPNECISVIAILNFWANEQKSTFKALLKGTAAPIVNLCFWLRVCSSELGPLFLFVLQKVYNN